MNCFPRAPLKCPLLRIAAELAGLTRRTFAELLGKYNVSIFNYPPSERTRDIKNAYCSSKFATSPQVTGRLLTAAANRRQKRIDIFPKLTILHLLLIVL